MKHKVNVALQVLPSSAEINSYAIVDEAIKVIQSAGIPYRVCPFETVMEGDYDQIMQIIKEVQEVCLQAGAENMLSYIKIQISRDRDVTIGDKMDKYD